MENTEGGQKVLVKEQEEKAFNEVGGGNGRGSPNTHVHLSPRCNLSTGFISHVHLGMDVLKTTRFKQTEGDWTKRLSVAFKMDQTDSVSTSRTRCLAGLVQGCAVPLYVGL